MTDSTLRTWRRDRLLSCGILVLTTLLLPAPPGSAQILERHAFSSGAIAASGGGFRVRGTLGEAGFVGRCSNASFVVGEGFWARAYFSMASDAPVVVPDGIPLTNELQQSFPNPFHRETTISFGVARPSPVKLSVFDVTGRRVVTLIDEEMPAGRYDRKWGGLDGSGRRVASGVYFYQLDIGAWSQTRRTIKLR